jgi:2-desacetyl-2-hydroxyethyl bacteriochlorophyllide A dehydrogenase
MRAVRHTARGIEVVDVPPPEKGVRVRVTSAGICGSDFHLIAAGPLPQTLGHEFGGVLDDGTVVAVRPNPGCGACEACAADQPQRCPASLTQILGVGVDGGLAEFVGVDEACLVPLPPSIDPADAGLVEPLAVAVHGLGGIPRGSRVLVVGAGPIGLCAIAVALHAGHDVSFLARHPAREAAARRLGAGPVTAGPYEVVVDAAGTESSAGDAVSRVAVGGTVVVVGTWWDPVTMDGQWQVKEATFRPSFMYGQADFAAAARVLASVPALRDALVTHHFALDDAAEAFRVGADRSTGAIKVLVHP